MIDVHNERAMEWINRSSVFTDAEYYAFVEDGNRFMDYSTELLLKHKGIVATPYSSRKYQNGTGETIQGIEFKWDKKIKQYGTMFIETHCKNKNGEYQEGGIYSKNNTWLYAQGDYDTLYYFSVKTLRTLCNQKGDKGNYPNVDASNGWRYFRLETPQKSAKGFKLPIEDAEKYAEFVIRGDMVNV